MVNRTEKSKTSQRQDVLVYSPRISSVNREQIDTADWHSRLTQQIDTADWHSRLTQQIDTADWHSRLT
jgi:hypothetical protein